VQLNKKWKVESSIAFIRKLFKGLYLREKPEIDKDTILADYAKGTLTDEQLAGVGLRVDQDENPTYESNWVELQSAGKSAA
jgi:phage host-nuclease inhibitor protein Gam